MKKLKIFFIIIFILISFLFVFGLILLYGPSTSFRDWLITTAMNTREHKYLATFFYDDETIEDCLNRNFISDFSFCTNLNEIEFIDYSDKEISFENEYEKQIFEDYNKSIDYKLITIEKERYKGYLAVIYNPSKIELAVTKYLGKDGQYLTIISEQNEAKLAINAGGFVDPTGSGTGGEPLGITIQNGKLLHETTYDNEYLKGGLVGITKDNKLFLGDITSQEAFNIGIRDAVSFGPYLIVNGQEATISGNGGGGLSPRTVIGQRKDGIMLFLVLEGDRTLGRGATYQDALEIMKNYSAHNASMLDGGSSSGMAVNYRLINDPTTKSGKHQTRPIPTAFILK
jgi:exopolysaccharide biosynthesis protein